MKKVYRNIGHPTDIIQDMSPEMKLEVCRINVNSTWLLWAYIMDSFYFSGFPGGTLVKNPPAMQETLDTLV